MSLEREDYVVTEKLSLQIYVVGAVKGFFCGLAHYLGRKNSISSTGLPLAVGYLLSFTENIGVFCCGKFLIGFSWGGTLAVLPIYFGEIATKSSRGIMLSTIVVSFQIGGILSMNINRFDSRIILKCVVPGLAVLFSIFFFFFGMETPHYYLLKNDKIISKSALEKLRNTTQNEIEKEFKEMQGDIIHTGEEKVMACFKANGWVKSVFVLLCLNFLQSLSVVNFMRILATEVFDRAGFNITVPQMFMIVDGIGAAGALFCLLLIDWIGRKKCLILSATGASLSLLMFELFRSYEDSYIPLFFFASSIIFLYTGIIPVREVFLGELFSLKFKMAGVALVNMHFFSMGLLLSYFSLTTYDLVNTNGSFYFGMIVCAVAAIFIHFCIPETKGKSLEHIQVILNRT
ncbi:facilitated trehalose transporter Tret1 isoform X2 [Leptinotarsa decemlineata]